MSSDVTSATDGPGTGWTGAGAAGRRVDRPGGPTDRFRAVARPGRWWGMDDTTHVTHNPAASRFEAVVDDRLAQLQYELAGGRLVITHTLVPRPLGGRGLGSALVAAAVAHAAAEGLTVGSQCWFADEWLDRHPDEAAQVGVRTGS